jgi:hypothetical protein
LRSVGVSLLCSLSPHMQFFDSCAPFIGMVHVSKLHNIARDLNAVRR